MPVRIHAGIWTFAIIAMVTGGARADIKPAEVLAGYDNIELHDTTATKNNGEARKVYVRVFDESGELTGPALVPMTTHSEAEWREILTPERYHILREEGTERPFTSELLEVKESGTFLCAACDLPLFPSDSKFESGTGWPSFFRPLTTENIREVFDGSAGMNRTRVICTRCASHLGHLFEDGPDPTGRRYCLDGLSLKFVPTAKQGEHAEKVVPAKTETAVLAAGCFWCVEAPIEEIKGVIDVGSGYAGDTKDTALYTKVSAGRTKHAEAVQVLYDTAILDYEDVLAVFFAIHDPTTLDRQGADVGHQYRSAIFYANVEQEAAARKFIAELTEKKTFSDPIVTTLEPLNAFYPAEDYHQNYVVRNPGDGYVRNVALPKLEKLRKALVTSDRQ